MLLTPQGPADNRRHTALVGFLGRLQRPGQVELQRLVQLGLGLFGGLCHGTVGLCLVRAGEGRPALPGQRLQQRILCKECIGGIGAGLRCLHRLFPLSLTGGQLLLADADVPAHLLHGSAGSVPGFLPGFFLFVELLEHGVLPAVGQLLLLRRVGLPGSGQGRAAVPQSAKLLQRLAPQGVLVLVIGRLQGLFGLLGGAAALGQRFQLGGQGLGAGAAGIQTRYPLGRAGGVPAGTDGGGADHG